MAALVAAMTLPVALRQSAPLVSAAITWSMLLLEGGLGEDATSQGYAAILALWITIYSVARHGIGRQPVAGLLWALACVWSSVLMVTGFDGASLLLTSIITVAPWFGGSLIRRERGLRTSAEAEAANVTADRERREGVAVAAERSRIAREVHDVLGHTLGLIVLQLGAAEQALTSSPGPARDSVRAARSAGKAALAEVRYLIGLDGHADSTAPVPGLADVPALVERTCEAGLDVTASIDPVADPLPAATDLAAYRIVQEALTNAMKHGTGAVDLKVESQGNEVRITVENATAPGRRDSTGSGLIGLGERAHSCGGSVTTEDRQGRFRLVATIPTEAPA